MVIAADRYHVIHHALAHSVAGHAFDIAEPAVRIQPASRSLFPQSLQTPFPRVIRCQHEIQLILGRNIRRGKLLAQLAQIAGGGGHILSGIVGILDPHLAGRCRIHLHHAGRATFAHHFGQA